MAADVAGYSRLTAADEEGTLDALRAHRAELIDPKIAEYDGRIANTAGDSLLIEFGSVVNALRAVLDIQAGMTARNADVPPERRIEFRVGINVGDVMAEGTDLLGDGVNVAARLEALAEPGGITLSGTAYDQVRDRVEINFEDLGEVKVKNLPRQVRAYRVAAEGAAMPFSRRPGNTRRLYAAAGIAMLVGVAGAAAWWWTMRPEFTPADPNAMAHALPSKPSIAVLPFDNLSEDPGQEVFSYGITDDIITDLSKISGIFVTARHSTKAYKEKPATTRRIAEDLGVRYVLSGGVRWAGDEVRITTHLADAIRGGTIWSERYDRESSDIFAVQSEVTRSVVKALAVTVKAREHDRVFQKHVSDIEAYDVWRRARATVEVPSRKNIEKGEELFRRAIELDPNFAGGHAGLSFNHSVKARFGYTEDRAAQVALAFEHAKRAIELDSEFAWSHIAYAGALLANFEFDAAVAAMRPALAIQPGDFESNLFMGFYLFRADQAASAIEHLKIAQNLGRVPTYRLLAFLAISYFINGEYGESEATWMRALDRFGLVRHSSLYVMLAAARIALDKPEAAAEAVAGLKRINPNYRITKARTLLTYKSEEFKRRLTELAVKAGVPE